MSGSTSAAGTTGSISPQWPSSGKLVWIVLCGLLLVHCVLYLDNAVDDAYVSYRYARSLVEGNGLTFNPGERVEGFSNPLWVFLSAGVLAFGVEDPHLAMQLLGVVCSAATVVLLFSLGTAIFARYDRRWAWLPPILLCLQGSFPGYACSGMETPLYVLLLVWALHRLVCTKPDLIAGVALGLAALTRPEAPFHAALLLGVSYLAARQLGQRWQLRDLALVGVGFGVLFGGWLIFRLAYFGELLPNTYYAKTGEPMSTMYARGRYYLGDYLGSVKWTPLAALALLLAARQWSLLTWAVAWLIAVLQIVLIGGDWMPQFRFFAHVAFLHVILITGGAIALFELLRRWGPRRALAGALVATTIVAGLSVARSLDKAPSVTANGEAIRQRYRAIGLWLREQRDVRRIALVDVGALAYYSRARIIDLAGLTDKTIARSPGRLVLKQYDPEYVLSREPDLIILHSSGPAIIDRSGERPKLMFSHMFAAEQRLLKHPGFVRNYSYATSFTIRSEGGRSFYEQHVFKRRGVQLNLEMSAAASAP